MTTTEALVRFVRTCSPEALTALSTYLQLRSEDYMQEGRSQAREGGKNWKLRSVALMTNAQALLTLDESIKFVRNRS